MLWRRRSGEEAAPRNEDVLLLIAELGANIRHADTKAALVLTGLLALGPYGAARLVDLTQSGSLWVAAPAVLSLLAGVYLLLTLVRVLHPRRGNPAKVSRYAWPVLAELREADAGSVSGLASRQDLWEQAITLSRIASRKFNLVTVALRWLVAGLALAALAAAVGGFGA